MNLVSGRIVEIYTENGLSFAKVSVGGAVTRTPLLLLPDASVGDHVLLDSGVAIARINAPPADGNVNDQ